MLEIWTAKLCTKLVSCCFFVAISEGTDITDVAQLAIFIGETKELVPMADTATVNYIFNSIVGALSGPGWTGPVLSAWLQMAHHRLFFCNAHVMPTD